MCRVSVTNGGLVHYSKIFFAPSTASKLSRAVIMKIAVKDSKTSITPEKFKSLKTVGKSREADETEGN